MRKERRRRKLCEVWRSHVCCTFPDPYDPFGNRSLWPWVV